MHTRNYYFLIVIFLQVFLNACQNKEAEISFFPGEYPGEAQAEISDHKLILSNHSLESVWSIDDKGSVSSLTCQNRYDGQAFESQGMILFAIELENGKKYTNLDFQLQGKPRIQSLVTTDSLPSQALRFSGKEISAHLVGDTNNLLLTWKAQLRDGSNYIRQNLEISTLSNSVKIKKVVFFDGEQDGANYAGTVLGSPIWFKNFFFGMEHPIAHSAALLARNLGSITQSEIDLTGIVNKPGEYIISVEHGGGSSDYNVQSVSLFENNRLVSTDSHPLNGAEGNSFYRLSLMQYDSSKTYSLKANVVNIEKATGTFHIHYKRDDVLNFYVNRTDELKSGEKISEWSVVGVSPEGQKRRAFLYYTERERARPYKQFLHYNCWWDITDDGASSFTSEQLIERMHAWYEKFIKPYDIKLNSFVFDDGWDDLDSVWYFDPVKFPNGFKEQAGLCRKFNAGIGVWMSPFGGYLENQQRRIASAHREGLETNDKGLSLAGRNYYQRFEERALDILNNYQVNYFKFDGFGGSEPQYLPDMEAGARLIKTLRKHNPDVFVNITVGSWPSPFWLQYADCTWRGSGDLHMAGKGTRTQQFMTYRDGTLYNNIVKKAPFYPLNSIMTVGIAYANLGHPMKCINDSIEDFKDMVWSALGAGSSLQELYISHDRMKPEFWPILAQAAKWAKENEGVLKDTHWVGGSPINLEVYGFASWKPGKGIIMLRNPDELTVSYDLKLDEAFELPTDNEFEFQMRDPRISEDSQIVESVTSKDTLKLLLKPFETKLLEFDTFSN